jgi:uncharacterized DUF497 family protein
MGSGEASWPTDSILTPKLNVHTFIRVDIAFDPAKREKTLKERGLDFADATEVFQGPQFTGPDERRAYGESRYITLGFLRGRMVVVVWTPRGGVRHVISMRKANDREKRRYQAKI